LRLAPRAPVELRARAAPRSGFRDGPAGFAPNAVPAQAPVPPRAPRRSVRAGPVLPEARARGPLRLRRDPFLTPTLAGASGPCLQADPGRAWEVQSSFGKRSWQRAALL